MSISIVRRLTSRERFLFYLVKKGHDECWDWSGCKDNKGYGQFSIGTPPKRKYYHAHRMSYEMFVSSIPEGLVIDHLCNNPSCCNPKHLEPKTIYENGRRGFTTVRTLKLGGTCRSGRHLLLNKSDFYLRKGGHKKCRRCWLEARVDARALRQKMLK